MPTVNTIHHHQTEDSLDLGLLLEQQVPPTLNQLIRQYIPFAIKLSIPVLLVCLALGSLMGELGWLKGLLIFILVTLLVGASVFATLLLHYRYRIFELYLYERGVVLKRGQKRYCENYENLQVTVRIMQYRSRPYYYYFLMFPGRNLQAIGTLNGDHSELVERLLKRCCDVQLPELTAQLNGGETLEFGKIRFNQEGIKVNAKKLLWSDGYCVSLKRGLFWVESRQKGWFSRREGVDYGDVPNAPAFVALLQSIGKYQ